MDLPKDGQIVLVRAKGTRFSVLRGRETVELVMKASFSEGRFVLEPLGDSAAWEGQPEIVEWVGFTPTSP